MHNMERLFLDYGGEIVNSIDDLTPYILGWVGLVYEHVLEEEKYTFVESVRNPHSLTILIKGPNDHTISQIKDVMHDCLSVVKSTLEDRVVVLGAGAFEVVAREHLKHVVKKTNQGHAQLGVEILVYALLVVSKTLAKNFGLDTQYILVGLQVVEDNKLWTWLGIVEIIKEVIDKALRCMQTKKYRFGHKLVLWTNQGITSPIFELSRSTFQMFHEYHDQTIFIIHILKKVLYTYLSNISTRISFSQIPIIEMKLISSIFVHGSS